MGSSLAYIYARMIIGVTGMIGSGKSTVAGFLRERLAAPIIDADQIGHQVLAQNPRVRLLVKLVFGSLERPVIARQVFASRLKRWMLNVVMHATMRRLIRQKLAAPGDYILDAALLFPMRLAGCCDRIIFVTAHKTLLYKRLAAKGYTAAQAGQRLAANRGVYKQQKKASAVLVNDGTLAELKAAVLSLEL